MLYKSCYRTDLKLSLLGYGTWGLGGDSYGSISEKKSTYLLSCAFNKGINFFDTSNIYGAGLSEERVGKAFKNSNLRSKVVIATKFGMLNHRATGWVAPQNFKIKHLRNSFENSLKRIKTDYVDILQLHSPSIKLLQDKTKIESILELLDRLKQEGKVNYFGVSVKSPQHAKLVMRYNLFKFIQLNLNLIDQRAMEYKILDLALKKKVSIISRTPLAFGYLAGSVKLKKIDHRRKWSIQQKFLWTKGKKIFIDNINKKNISSLDLSLLFATHHPSIKSTIPGMMKINEIEENMRFLKLKKLSKKELKKITEVYKNNRWIE
jgi:aryl-alcohol dehydrogenase-like predicted oxidoreductase